MQLTIVVNQAKVTVQLYLPSHANIYMYVAFIHSYFQYLYSFFAINFGPCSKSPSSL